MHPVGQLIRRERLANFSRPAALLFGFQVALLVAMVASIATRAWYEHLWVAVLLTVVTMVAFLPAVIRGQERRWWFYYVAGIYAYTLARSFADNAGFPVRAEYAAAFDRWLFLGLQPVTFLQERFFDPTDVSLLDWAAVWVHWSFFVVPHVMAVAVFVGWRRWFPEYVMIIVGTMWLGLFFFFLVPTAPPWLASQLGALDQVYRIMDFVGGRVSLATYRHFYASLGEPNSVAAVPSIHMATTYGLYLWARYRLPAVAPVLLVYAGLMALALVYLGEHYVFDLLVGIACATAVAVSVESVAPRVVRRPVTEPAFARLEA
jgi:hypothetical protein